MPKFQKGVSGNPGGRPRADPETVDLLAEIRRQLSQFDPGNRQSKGAELVGALIAEAWGGDVKACIHLIDRIHGKVGGKPDVLDIGDIVAEVAARAEKRRLELALLEKRVALAGKQLDGPADQINLEDIAREMVRRSDEYDAEQAAANRPTRAEKRAAKCGFVEISPSPGPAPAPPPAAAVEPTPEPPTGPPVLEGEYFDMPGFGCIKIDRPTK